MRVAGYVLGFWRVIASGVLLVLVLSGCARQTLEQRAAIEVESAEAWDEYFDNLDAYDDPTLAAYVEGVLARVAGPKAHRPAIQVMNSSYPHAYVSRRYGIRITRGMLATLQSEAELAFVIGHELSHLHLKATPDFRHLDLNSIKDPKAALSLASEMRMGQEVKADLRAAFLLKNAGYDGAAARNVLAGFERGAQTDGDEYDLLFRTHPTSSERLALLPPGENGEANADRYLKAIEGLPFSLPGTGLRQSRGRFLAPFLGLSAPSPEGFGLAERDGETLIFSRQGDNMAITASVYTAEPQSAVSALEGPIYQVYSKGVFKDFNGEVSLGQLRDVRMLDVAPGVSRASGVARFANTDPSAEVWMATWALDERWLTMTFIYPSHRRERAARIIQAFETGVEVIPAAARPVLRLKRYSPGDRLERLAAGFGEGADALERFRWINGLPEGGQPKPGQLLKTIEIR